MKIGILTFHWATNYGAVLQTYALQTYLESLGHEVVVVNYKPRVYDFNFWNYVRYRKFKQQAKYTQERLKEKALCVFRKCYLNQTSRVSSQAKLPGICCGLDAVISGSDQVLNPFFLTSGERKNKCTGAYYLDFKFERKKIGYAVSFGCTSFPNELIELASKMVKNFSTISVRETSGVSILARMGISNLDIAPDPTLLQDSHFYENIISDTTPYSKHKCYCFFIRHIEDRKMALSKCISSKDMLWNNDDDDYSLEGWLSKIKESEIVITDSFHCVVMCLKLHKAFFVITEQNGNVGMNDRFYTLLDRLGLEDRIIYKEDVSLMIRQENDIINWEKIDGSLSAFKQLGTDYLKKSLQ